MTQVCMGQTHPASGTKTALPARKVLLITELFPPKTGGSGRWFFEIYRRLPRNQVCIAAGEDSGQDDFDRTHDLRLVRMPLTLPSWGVLNWSGVSGYARALSRLGRLVRANRVWQIHCGRCLPEGLMALALKLWLGTPYLCYAHGEELNYAHDSREYRWLMRRVFRNSDLIVANSRNTERILREEWGLPPERVRVLHPGVDTQRFVPARPDPDFRRAMGWEGRAVVLTVGRLQKRKGHDMMIRALREVRRSVPDVLYAVVGDGEERRPLEELVAAEGLQEHVQFCGELDDERMIRCYQQCDLFVLPNRQVGQDIEGFGMVLLEAQACGKPVLAGASGGTAETMHIPQTGQVVDCAAPEALAGRVAELLVDAGLRERMGRSARAWVVEHFDWSSLSRRAEQLFRPGNAQGRRGTPTRAAPPGPGAPAEAPVLKGSG
jgi:phosphatidyl-myo-inositol dimannoside synthase